MIIVPPCLLVDNDTAVGRGRSNSACEHRTIDELTNGSPDSFFVGTEWVVVVHPVTRLLADVVLDTNAPEASPLEHQHVVLGYVVPNASNHMNL